MGLAARGLAARGLATAGGARAGGARAGDGWRRVGFTSTGGGTAGRRLPGITGRHHHPPMWCALEMLHQHAWRLGDRRRSLLSTTRTDGAIDPDADLL
jgi:hypothetical protein